MGQYFSRTWLSRAASLFLVGLLLVIVAKEYLADGLWATAVKEVGFAMMISFIIWGLFEAQISSETEEAWSKRIEKVSESVFQAVLRKNLPKELLDEVNNLILDISLIRRDMQVTYTISDLKIGNEDPCFEAVSVKSTMDFCMQNISSDVVEWPVKVLLPNPVDPRLKAHVKVLEVSVRKGGESIKIDFAAAQEKFRAALDEADSRPHIPFDAGDVSLNAGEECEFSATYIMVKECEDSELLQTLYPTKSLRVTVFDSDPDGRRTLFAESVHRTELEPFASHEETRDDGAKDAPETVSFPTARIFKIPGYVLPHQGVLIWWKRKPT